MFFLSKGLGFRGLLLRALCQRVDPTIRNILSCLIFLQGPDSPKKEYSILSDAPKLAENGHAQLNEDFAGSTATF